MEVTNIMCQKAIDYKKSVAGRFMLVEGAHISSRIAGEDFCVTRKIDGHLQVLFYENGQVVMLNSRGNRKAESLKCLDEFTSKMSAAGISSAVVAAELYFPNDGGRPRCGDVSSALADVAKRDQLALAVFDIVGQKCLGLERRAFFCEDVLLFNTLIECRKISLKFLGVNTGIKYR